MLRNPIYVQDLEGETRMCRSTWKAHRLARQKRRGRRGHLPEAHPTKKVTAGRRWAGTGNPKMVRLRASLERLLRTFHAIAMNRS